jgi:Fe-S cluster assembly iron-binding protein IscA
MEIKITEEAKEKLNEVLKQSLLKEPAVRIIFAGMG